MTTPVQVSGANRIGGEPSREGEVTFTSFDPRTGRPGGAVFAEATPAEVARAATLAGAMFRAWGMQSPRAARARFLRAAAERLKDWQDAIVSTANEETGLGAARLVGELDRTCGQLRAFAALVDEGSYVEAIVSLADPSATPIPRPDLRRMLIPIGPVAVFTPSNFPLAFGVAGADTAAALAAGCPVIVKGHPAHPGTSELCARAIETAASGSGLPPGVLSLLQARSLEPAQALVRTAEIEAVAFTGSQAAGRAIHDLAAARPRPVPVYAEMGSVNPVFIGRDALAARAGDIAEGLATSITMGTGQFCTKPGLVFVPDDDAGRAFARDLAVRVGRRPVGVLLYAGLRDALAERIHHLAALPGVERLTPAAAADPPGTALACESVLMATDAATFLATPALWEECFGPVSIVVRCPPDGGALALAEWLQGNLTATIHAEPSEHHWAVAVADMVAAKVGRVVWNGYPTGVAVTAGMCHGGPYPASTSPAHTSVGVTAIRRFLRPIAYQNTPDALLPEPLRDANPLGIQRLVDGLWTKEAVHRPPSGTTA